MGSEDQALIVHSKKSRRDYHHHQGNNSHCCTGINTLVTEGLGLPTYFWNLQTINFKVQKRNRKKCWTHPINDSWFKLSLLRSAPLQSFQGCTFFTYKEKILQVQSYTCIYNKLYEQYMECLIKDIHQTWYMKETQHKVGRRILLINNSEWDKCTTQRLK